MLTVVYPFVGVPFNLLLVVGGLLVVLTFSLALQATPITVLITSFSIFFMLFVYMFALGFEFLPYIFLMVVLGAVLILTLMAVFFVDSTNTGFGTKPTLQAPEDGVIKLIVYTALGLKVIVFFSTFRYFSFSQILIQHQMLELESLRPLYFLDGTGYAPMLLLLALLLFVLTLNISVLFKRRGDV